MQSFSSFSHHSLRECRNCSRWNSVEDYTFAVRWKAPKSVFSDTVLLDFSQLSNHARQMTTLWYWNRELFLVAASHISTDTNIVVTGKHCQFSHWFFSNSDGQWINTAKEKTNEIQMKLFICVQLLYSGFATIVKKTRA